MQAAPSLPFLLHPSQVATAGMVALAVAMGIGRFAFTPLLPMMLADGVVDLPAASWLASANYIGYLLGALACTFQPWLWRGAVNGPRLVRASLAATVVLTVGMALPLPGTWPALRFAAGVASAFAFIYTSGWCLGQLARLGQPAMGALIYTGPGMGILASGLAGSGMVALGWRAASGWLVFGVLAAALGATVWRRFRPEPAAAPAQATAAAPAPARARRPLEMALFALAYGCAGLGYIITATFLPVIARQALPGSAWLDLFWPIVGLGTTVGALVASRIPGRGDLRWKLAGCYVIQAAGVAASVVSPTAFGFALGSLLLGLPFTAITFFAMQEVRRLRPANGASAMGLVTALYGIGQVVGPPLTAALVTRSTSPGAGFTLSLEIATGSLIAGALLYALLTRLYPVRR